MNKDEILELARQTYTLNTVFEPVHHMYKDNIQFEVQEIHSIEWFRGDENRFIVLTNRNTSKDCVRYIRENGTKVGATIYDAKADKWAPIIKEGINIQLEEALKIIYNE